MSEPSTSRDPEVHPPAQDSPWHSRFACPGCDLAPSADWRCEACGDSFFENGVVRLETPDRLVELEAFARDYGGPGEREATLELTPDDIRALPERVPGHTGHSRLYWATRRESFRKLGELLGNLPQSTESNLAVDVGSGYGWLTHRLVQMGWRVTALDASRDKHLGVGAIEGLGLGDAALPVQGDLEWPRFQPTCLDLVIFNASLHYSADVGATISRWREKLRTGGQMIMMDTPIVSEERAAAADAVRPVTRAEITRAMEAEGLDVQWHPVPRGMRWRFHRLRNWAGRAPGFELPIAVGLLPATRDDSTQ